MFKPCIDTTIPFPLDGDTISVRLLVGDITLLMAEESARTAALQQLSPYRRAKAEAISHARGKAQSIGAALLLDSLLNEVGLHERDMSYIENEHGKPGFAMKSEELRNKREYPFSLSHSGSLSAAALIPLLTSHRVALGLDLQRITRYRPELVRRVFTAKDREMLAEIPDEMARQRCFTQLWCRAEAYGKATGEGLKWPSPTPSSSAHFHDFEIGDDYCGSLCLIGQ